jgi:hypothetical protein
MAERRRARLSTGAWIRRLRSLRRPWRAPDATEALAALLHAWTTTVVASLLFLSAVALSQVWDSTVFQHALCDTLTSDPELPTSDFFAANPAGDCNLSAK